MIRGGEKADARQSGESFYPPQTIPEGDYQMAKLTIRISTTGAEFETSDIDFAQVTPQQIIDNMPGNLADAGAGNDWKMFRGTQPVDGHVTLDQLGFRDGDTAELMAKLKAA
jgi:hypothetical protein